MSMQNHAYPYYHDTSFTSNSFLYQLPVANQVIDYTNDTICDKDLSQQEYDALYSLYNATSGDSWCNIYEPYQKWMFPSDLNSPCIDNWVGLSCYCSLSSNYSSIAAIDLSSSCLYGTLPPEIGYFSSLSVLFLATGELYGTIPVELKYLSQLFDLSLYYNSFSGTVSNDIIAGLLSLEQLDLSENYFDGRLPDMSIMSPQMESVYFYKNHFTGTISSAISTLANLIVFDAGNNYLNATIPESIMNMKSIQYLALPNNYFHGTVPPLQSMEALDFIQLSGNFFDGSLDFLHNCSALYLVEIDINYFTGNLDVLTTLSSIEYVEASGNLFTGTLPPALFNMSNFYFLGIGYNIITSTLPDLANIFNTELYYGINILNIGYNYVTGTIPESFSNLQLFRLDLSYNQLSGSLATNLFGNWVNGFSIALNNNHLTNTLPSSLSLLVNIESFIINSNLFSGSIPDSINELSLLFNLYLYNNFFTSTIPSALGDLQQLAFIWFSNNQLTGSFPSSLHRLPYLTQVLVDNNQLTGNPFLSFNATSNPLIQVINLANNRFSGSITASLFDYPKLLALSAVSNCMSGSLPPDICSSPAAASINVIALDGLSSNEACPANQDLNRYRPPHVDGIYQRHRFHSSIPPCFMQLPALQTLHLSGNGLFGSIPDILANSSITDLSLSSNALTGSIPPRIQLQSFLRLDLASNLLGGSLRHDFQVSSSQSMLTLAVNRISGPLPSSIIHVSSKLTELNILSSNIFSCSNYEIPTMDAYAASYTCGSYTMNVSSYVWLSLFGSIVLVIVLVYYILKPSLHPITDDKAQKASIIAHGVSSFSSSTALEIAGDRGNFSQAKLSGWLASISASMKLQADLVVLWMLTATIPFKATSEKQKQASKQRLSILDVTQSNPLHSFFLSSPSSSSIASSPTSVATTGTRSRKKSAQPMSWTTMSTVASAEKIWQKLIESRAFLLLLLMFRYWAISIAIVLCLLLIPIYIGLNAIDSIVDYPYGYVVSIAFVHGYGAVMVCGSIVLLLLLVASSFIIQLQAIFTRHLSNHHIPSKDTISSSSIPASTSMLSGYPYPYLHVCKKYALIYTFHLINLVMTITVNAAYVNALLTNPNLTRTSLLVMQIAVSTFKLFWNVWYIPWSTRRLIPYMSLSRTMQNRLIMSLTNFIIAPGIATMVSNQSCFYYIFIKHDPVTTSASIPVCLQFQIIPFSSIPPECDEPAETTVFTSCYPAFQYSYACGTALLVTYVPILLYTYIASGLIAPLIRYVLAMNPQLLRPRMLSLLNNLFFMDDRDIAVSSSSMNMQEKATSPSGETEEDIRRGLLRVKGRGIIVSLLVHMTVLLTYGIACPILGIAIVAAIVNDCLIWKMLIGRYVSMIAWIQQIFYDDDHVVGIATSPPPPAATSSLLAIDVSLLEEDCKDSWCGFFACHSICVVTITSYWALLFFDMIADPYSDMNGLVATISYGIAAPLLVLVYHRLLGRYPRINMLHSIATQCITKLGAEQVLSLGGNSTSRSHALLASSIRQVGSHDSIDIEARKGIVYEQEVDDNIVKSPLVGTSSLPASSNIARNSQVSTSYLETTGSPFVSSSMKSVAVGVDRITSADL